MSIKRPQKAPLDPVTNEELLKLKYPLVGSPKLDGFRCIIDGVPKTSSMKEFKNPFIREVLKAPEFQGLDGELIVGSPTDPNVYNNTTGPLRREWGEPDFKFYVFDNWLDGHFTYLERWLSQTSPAHSKGRIVVLEQRFLANLDDVLEYEAKMLEVGYEGIMIRSLDGRYKEGRCTFNEMNIFKRKPFAECEATIVGFVEAMENLNPLKKDEMGLGKRSSHKANKRPKGTLGAVICQCDLWPKPFNAGMGEGFTQEAKDDIWNRQEDFMGCVATVKYQAYGSIDAPRIGKVIKILPKELV
jgi:DNA ligase 1